MKSKTNKEIQWPADAVERRAVDSLVPYARNARTHSDAQVAQIAKSIEDYGFTVPVLVDDAGNVIAGHGRILAAKALWIADIPVMVARGWSAAKRRSYVILDNKLALNSGWDTDILRLELADLTSDGVDVGSLGFDAAELASILDVRPTGLTDPDDAPEPPVKPVAIRGDLWALGRHRLLCGDCTQPANVDYVLGGRSPDAVVTDPPYGVSLNYDSFVDTLDAVSALIGKVMPIVLAMDCPVALTPGVPAMWRYPQPAWVMAWVHPAATGGCSWGFGGVNPILVYGADPYLKSGKGRRADHIVLAADRDGLKGHPAIKPIKVWLWLIERLTTSPGDAVFEPFAGSGTSFIACDQLGRDCFGIELSPAYCDVIIQRWQNFTGQSATLDGRTFEQVKAERQKQAA